MLAILYIFTCLLTGFVLCSFCFPFLKGITDKTYDGKDISLNSFYVKLPAWYLSGTILVTWLVYIMASIFKNNESPLTTANAIVIPVFFILSVLGVLLLWRKGTFSNRELFKSGAKKIKRSEWVFLALILFLVTVLMWRTFYVWAGELRIGYSVFSDFSPHIGMIRSFSYGNNFPTMYSHFTGEDIRYHFMYQFYVGNLEFLGMRLDFAFNIPSMISMLSVYWLLFVLAVKIFGKRSAGYIACLFFTFRCSPSLFTWISKLAKGTDILTALRENTEFIGYTTNESWGLWNLNVYCNQRHLALCIAVMLLIIICYLPNLYHMAERLKERRESRYKVTFAKYFTDCFFHKEAWKVRSLFLPVGLGILLGATAFWNGAALLATIMVLFMFAVFSDYRLEYLITALIAAGMSLLQSNIFVWGEVVSPQFQFGFISENTSFFGTLDYIARLTGIFWWVILAAFAAAKGVKRYIIAAFSTPFVFSFFVSLTSDVTVNHKYIMMSLMLVGVFAAGFIVWLWGKKDIFIRAICVLLVIVMTATGFYDFTVVYKRNVNYIALDMDDPLTLWIDENTDSQDVFLTSWYSINQVVFGGAMLYFGWPYYAWSAGYDTNSREKEVNKMYSADSPEYLDRLVKKNGISYIIIDIDNRTSNEYNLREDVIDATYEKCYCAGEGDYMISVYDTSKPIY